MEIGQLGVRLGANRFEHLLLIVDEDKCAVLVRPDSEIPGHDASPLWFLRVCDASFIRSAPRRSIAGRNAGNSGVQYLSPRARRETARPPGRQVSPRPGRRRPAAGTAAV